MDDEIFVVPHYVIVLIPLLTAWWSHRCGTRREYGLLVACVAIVCIPLLMLSHYRDLTCTWYAGPLSSTWIKTVQLPLSVFVTATIAAIPIKWRLVRNFIAIIIGEYLLVDTLIS